MPPKGVGIADPLSGTAKLGFRPRRRVGTLSVAVGTLIAERPPHRTVRAAFPHTAPTLGE